MSTATLKRRVERQGFRLLELARSCDSGITPAKVDGQRFLIVGPSGLILRGHEEPLTREQVEEFLAPFEDRSWLP